MAEFAYVLRQFDRMCKASAGCINCPLHKPDSVSDECSIGAFVNNHEHIEREVMAWASEHPEPVYPTWVEWLTAQDVLRQVRTTSYSGPINGCVDSLVQYIRTDKMYQPIPTDIAEKLGIEPKEEQHG